MIRSLGQVAGASTEHLNDVIYRPSAENVNLRFASATELYERLATILPITDYYVSPAHGTTVQMIASLSEATVRASVPIAVFTLPHTPGAPASNRDPLTDRPNKVTQYAAYYLLGLCLTARTLLPPTAGAAMLKDSTVDGLVAKTGMRAAMLSEMLLSSCALLSTDLYQEIGLAMLRASNSTADILPRLSPTQLAAVSTVHATMGGLLRARPNAHMHASDAMPYAGMVFSTYIRPKV